MPHPHNFSPIAAVALFGAATFPRRWAAILIPLGSLLLSDVLLQITYSLIVRWHPTILGLLLLDSGSIMLAWSQPWGSGFFSASDGRCQPWPWPPWQVRFCFFLITNLAYVFEASSPYPKNGAGILLSYEAGLPFFQNTLLGDAFFSTVLFGSLALAEYFFPALRRVARPVSLEVI